MNNSPLPEVAESAASDAAFPSSSSLLTPAEPEKAICISGPELPAASGDAAGLPTRVTATPMPSHAMANAPAPALPQMMGLKPRQRVAAQALAAGKSVDAAAELAGIFPSTLYRWKKHDARFIAAMNAWRIASQQSAHDVLLSAVGHAAHTVLEATQKGDVHASLVLLKSLGAMEPRKIGSPLQAIVEKEIAAETAMVKAALGGQGRKISLHLLEQVLNHMEMDEPTREAYRSAFARHRAELKSRERPIAPLLRPVTPEALRDAALAMQGRPGRSFRNVPEPSLRQYHRYAEQLQQEELSEGDSPAESQPVPDWLKAAAPPAIRVPEYCWMTITAVADPGRKDLLVRLSESEGIWPEEKAGELLKRLPYRLKNPSATKNVERHAREFESLGATVEIRPIFDPAELPLEYRDESESADSSQATATSPPDPAMELKKLDALLDQMTKLQ